MISIKSVLAIVRLKPDMFICGVVLQDAFVFKRIFETLIINLDALLLSASIPD